MNKKKCLLLAVVALFFLNSSKVFASPYKVKSINREEFDYYSSDELSFQFNLESNNIGAIAFFTKQGIYDSLPAKLELQLCNSNGELIYEENRLQEHRIRAYELFWFGFPALKSNDENNYTVLLKSDGIDLTTVASISLFADVSISTQARQNFVQEFSQKIKLQSSFWNTYVLLMIVFAGLFAMKFWWKQQTS